MLRRKDTSKRSTGVLVGVALALDISGPWFISL